MTTEIKSIITARHPSYNQSVEDWEKWRLTYAGGDEFKDTYLRQFTTRERQDEFALRAALTPVPRYAGAAIDDIRNSIFQRLHDISRVGGSTAYHEAVQGKNGGVDREGSTMNAFLGMKVLTDLLTMRRVGVYIDNSVVTGQSLAESAGARPYLYPYAVEDILSWKCSDPENPMAVQAVLLRDKCMSFDPISDLPTGDYVHYRKVWIDPVDRRVRLQFINADGLEVDRDGNPSNEPIVLELDRIPFVHIDLGQSLIKHVCDYQIALLNLTSSDIWYALKSNFPFFVEQRDMRAVGSHLKNVATEDGTSTSGGQNAAEQDIRVGTTQGRAYPIGANQPAFINPSSEPLKASMELQKEYRNTIRELVNLAVTTLASRQSAESKSLDNQGLEAGLSYIGLVLENAERQIAEHWASYENKNPKKRQVATISYPDRYSLKTDEDRIDESDKLADLVFRVPSRTAKREIAKRIVNTLLVGKVKPETLRAIDTEIDESDYLTSDPDTILQSIEKGIVGEKTASIALGFNDEEHLVARKDHAQRLARIQEAQTPPGGGPDRPAARGLDDLDGDPESGRREREEVNNPDTQADRSAPVRGRGRRTRR